VTYIRTTPKKLWQALTDPEFVRRYFYETRRSRIGSGEFLENGRARRKGGGRRRSAGGQAAPELVLKWRHELRPQLHAEGFSRMTYDIEKDGTSTKLTVTHEMNRPDSKFIEGVSEGWPSILASLKSLLETGESLVETPQVAKGTLIQDFNRRTLNKNNNQKTKTNIMTTTMETTEFVYATYHSHDARKNFGRR